MVTLSRRGGMGMDRSSGRPAWGWTASWTVRIPGSTPPIMG